MAMDALQTRDNLFVRLFQGVTLDPADETKVKESLLIWTEEIRDMVRQAQIDLLQNDIPVNPGTFETDETTPVPLTGQGESTAVTLENKIL